MLTSSLTASSSSSPTALFPSSTSSFTAPSPCSLSFPFLNASTRTPKTKWEKTSTLRIQASMSSSMIEKEVPEAQRPTTFLRETDENASSSSDSIRARFEKMIREAQDSVFSAIELADGGGKFKEDVWSRHGGGGGINRVLQDGAVFEKSGVNVSVVYGVMPPEAYRAAKPSENGDVKPGPIPFVAVGISSVLHPKNPFAPTLHFNYRYFETDAPKAYIPIIEKRKDTPFTDQHKEWQQLRRGRFVEFNLVYDRGTTFGLKTGGRIESILVSLPLTARWEYDHQPEEGTE